MYCDWMGRAGFNPATDHGRVLAARSDSQAAST